MTVEQKKLALQIGVQLSVAKASTQQQIKQTLERSIVPALTNGATRNGVTVSAKEIQEAVGADVWKGITADAEALKAFAEA